MAMAALKYDDSFNPATAKRKPVIVWTPQPGPQTLLITCPVRDIFYGGARGGGKTDGMLGHWLKHREKYRGKAQGIIFRRRYKQLDRIKKRGIQLFRKTGARFMDSKDKYCFVWPDGSTLLLRHLEKVTDADEYQGHEYNWMAFEELTQWASPEPIDMCRAALRSAEGVECWFISNGNPGGVGHQWVKDRYIVPAPPMTPFIDRLDDGDVITRVFIPAKVWDNKILLENDPEYISRLKRAGPKWLVQAWLDGDWDIVAGGYLEGIWRHDTHVCHPFEIPMTWPRWRAMDWGFAKPYSIGWYTINPDGVIYRYRELYGYGGKPNVGTRQTVTKVAQLIKKIEEPEIKAGIRFKRNPADSSCWNQIGTERTIASQFSASGIRWHSASKGPRSRVNGAQLVVDCLENQQFKVFETNRHFLRTVPVIPADPDDPEDVDTESEDHAWDELRYSLTARHKPREQKKKKKGEEPFTWEWLIAGEQKKKSKYNFYRPGG